MYELNSDFQKRRIAIYARVSTEHEAQLSALENQVDWYKPILAARPEWSLTAQYIDEGITGTSAEKRPQFMKMISDAKQKKFDTIITREVSRFARNTVDTLQYTRKLKSYGVEVFFINDNIKTFDGDGELRLTIMATLAQDESRKTSIRVKAGQQTSMENGVFYGNGNILGYDRVGKEMVINAEQAKTVRMIFDMYLSGLGVTKIQYELERLGRLTSTGKTKWYASYISHMLRNSFYCGIITYHKEYTPDYLTQKKIVNYGDLEKLEVKGTHTPIISVEEYNKVQKIIESRTIVEPSRKKGCGRIGKKNHTTVWGRLLICQCGKKFNQHFHNRKDRSPGVDYQCYTSANLGSQAERIKRGLSLENTCDSPFIPSWKLELMAKKIFEKYINNASETVELAYQMLTKHIEDNDEVFDNTDTIQRKEEEVQRFQKKIKNLLEMREDGDIDKDYFKERKNELETSIAILQQEIKGLTPKATKRKPDDCKALLSDLKKHLESYVESDSETIRESVVEAFVKKIWVSKTEYRWYLRSESLSDDISENEHIMIDSFTIDLEEAKKYLYFFSTKRRIYNWTDINVSIWL